MVDELVSHLFDDGTGKAACGTRMFTFWSGCWANTPTDTPTCKRCQRIMASQAKLTKRVRS